MEKWAPHSSLQRAGLLNWIVHDRHITFPPLPDVLLLPVFFIDLVSKAHGVHNSEFEAHVALLEFISVGFERDSRLVVLGGLPLKLGVEQRVHQSGLTQTRLTWTEETGHVTEILQILTLCSVISS